MKRALLITACLLAASPVLAQEAKPLRSITVTGTAERHVAPDEARVMVNVNVQDMKLAAAKAAHDKKLGALLAIAKSQGIDAKDIRTENSTVQPQYDYTNNKRVFRGYEVASRITMVLHKTDDAGALLEKLANAGFDDTDLNYDIARPDAVRDALLADAVKNAHDKAEQLAAAAGASLAHVYSINEGGVNFVQPPRPMMMRAMAAPAAAPVNPPVGEEQVSATVTVTYELKE